MKDRWGFLAYRAGTALVGVLPATAVHRVGRGAGRLAFLWSGPRRRMAERHMSRVLGPAADHTAAAREVFANYGRYWAEVLWLRPRRVDEVIGHLSVEGLEHVRAARDAGRGMILALPHVGNWEVAGPIAAQEGVDLLAVAEALPNRRVTDWFVRIREMLGIEVILTDEGAGLMRRLAGWLERGGAVALVSDRNLGGGGIAVRFFGEETALPGGPAVLALRTGAPILPVAVFFRPGRGHRAVVLPPLDLDDEGGRRDRLEGITSRLAEALEELISRAPTQWHLVQPNWPSDREASG